MANTDAKKDETFTEMADATAEKSGVVGKLLIASLIVVSVAVTAFVGFAIFNGVTGQGIVNSDKYQAVFVDNGADPQVFFGKLSNIDREYAQLEEVFFLQVQTAQQNGEQQNRLVLGRLDNSQLYKADQDELLINTDKILYWENLSDESQVSKAIDDFKATGGGTVEGTDTSFPPADSSAN